VAPDRRPDCAAHRDRRAHRRRMALCLRRPRRRDERRRLLVLRPARTRGQPRESGRAGHQAEPRGDGAGPRAARRASRAAAVHHPFGAAQRVRHRSQPRARGGRGHGGPAPAAAARPGQERPRARVRSHQEPRHPRFLDRRDGGGRDRGDRESLPVLAALRRRRGRRPTTRLDRTHRDRHLCTARRVAAAAGCLAAARVPRRCDRSRAPRPRVAARGCARSTRARRAGAPSRRQPGDGVALHRQPAPKTRHSDAVLHAPADRRVRALWTLDANQTPRRAA
jgi:hypothetical protein